jgi:hypothetical protein
MAMAVCRPSGDAAADEEEYGQRKCHWDIVRHDRLPRLIDASTKRDDIVVGAATLVPLFGASLPAPTLGKPFRLFHRVALILITGGIPAAL